MTHDRHFQALLAVNKLCVENDMIVCSLIWLRTSLRYCIFFVISGMLTFLLRINAFTDKISLAVYV